MKGILDNCYHLVSSFYNYRSLVSSYGIVFRHSVFLLVLDLNMNEFDIQLSSLKRLIVRKQQTIHIHDPSEHKIVIKIKTMTRTISPSDNKSDLSMFNVINKLLWTISNGKSHNMILKILKLD